LYLIDDIELFLRETDIMFLVIHNSAHHFISNVT